MKHRMLFRSAALRLLSCRLRPGRAASLRPGVPDLAVCGNDDTVRRVPPDLVPHRAHRKSEYARGVGAVAVAARERLQHELALDLLDRGADQHRHDFVGERA